MNQLRTAGYLKIGLVGLEADAAASGPPEPAPATHEAKPAEPKP